MSTQRADGCSRREFAAVLTLAQGLAAHQSTGAEADRPYSLALLAEPSGQCGQGEDGFVALAEVYGWFTEGFDTADLHAAKALLEELEAEEE